MINFNLILNIINQSTTLIVFFNTMFHFSSYAYAAYGCQEYKNNKGFSPHWMSVKLPDNFQMSVPVSYYT